MVPCFAGAVRSFFVALGRPPDAGVRFVSVLV